MFRSIEKPHFHTNRRFSAPVIPSADAIFRFGHQSEYDISTSYSHLNPPSIIAHPLESLYSRKWETPTTDVQICGMMVVKELKVLTRRVVKHNSPTTKQEYRALVFQISEALLEIGLRLTTIPRRLAEAKRYLVLNQESEFLTPFETLNVRDFLKAYKKLKSNQAAILREIIGGKRLLRLLRTFSKRWKVKIEQEIEFFIMTRHFEQKFSCEKTTNLGKMKIEEIIKTFRAYWGTSQETSPISLNGKYLLLSSEDKTKFLTSLIMELEKVSKLGGHVPINKQTPLIEEDSKETSQDTVPTLYALLALSFPAYAKAEFMIRQALPGLFHADELGKPRLRYCPTKLTHFSITKNRRSGIYRVTHHKTYGLYIRTQKKKKKIYQMIDECVGTVDIQWEVSGRLDSPFWKGHLSFLGFNFARNLSIARRLMVCRETNILIDGEHLEKMVSLSLANTDLEYRLERLAIQIIGEVVQLKYKNLERSDGSKRKEKINPETEEEVVSDLYEAFVSKIHPPRLTRSQSARSSHSAQQLISSRRRGSNEIVLFSIDERKTIKQTWDEVHWRDYITTVYQIEIQRLDIYNKIYEAPKTDPNISKLGGSIADFVSQLVAQKIICSFSQRKFTPESSSQKTLAKFLREASKTIRGIKSTRSLKRQARYLLAEKKNPSLIFLGSVVRLLTVDFFKCRSSVFFLWLQHTALPGALGQRVFCKGIDKLKIEIEPSKQIKTQAVCHFMQTFKFFEIKRARKKSSKKRKQTIANVQAVASVTIDRVGTIYSIIYRISQIEFYHTIDVHQQQKYLAS